MSVHAVYESNDRESLTLSMGNALVDGSFPPTPLAGIGQRRNSGSQATFIMGTWTRNIAKNDDIQVTAYINDFHASPGLPMNDYRYQQAALLLSRTIRPSKTHHVTWGMDGRIDLMDGSNSDPFLLSKTRVHTGIAGIYLQDEWRFAPRWTLNLGARVDYEAYGGFKPSARGSIAWTPTDDTILYAAVSRAFQMPPAAFRFLDMPLVNGFVHVVGHRSMDVVTLFAYELGYRDRFLDRLETSVNLFWHEYADWTTISAQIGPPGLIRMDIDNRADLSSYGVELDARFEAAKNLTLLGHYTYERINWRSSVPWRDTETMTAPEHKFMIGARWNPTDDLHVSGHLHYVDAVEAPNPANPFHVRDVDAYFRLDLRGEYEFKDDSASIAVGVRNLLDRDHYEGGTLFLNDAEVPRMLYAELRLAIK